MPRASQIQLSPPLASPPRRRRSPRPTTGPSPREPRAARRRARRRGRRAAPPPRRSAPAARQPRRRAAPPVARRARRGGRRSRRRNRPAPIHVAAVAADDARGRRRGRCAVAPPRRGRTAAATPSYRDRAAAATPSYRDRAAAATPSYRDPPRPRRRRDPRLRPAAAAPPPRPRVRGKREFARRVSRSRARAARGRPIQEIRARTPRQATPRPRRPSARPRLTWGRPRGRRRPPAGATRRSTGPCRPCSRPAPTRGLGPLADGNAPGRDLGETTTVFDDSSDCWRCPLPFDVSRRGCHVDRPRTARRGDRDRRRPSSMFFCSVGLLAVSSSIRRVAARLPRGSSENGATRGSRRPLGPRTTKSNVCASTHASRSSGRPTKAAAWSAACAANGASFKKSASRSSPSAPDR